METSSEIPLDSKKRAHSRSRSKSPESSEERSIKKIRIDNSSSDEFVLKEITVNIEKLSGKQIRVIENHSKTDNDEVCSISDTQQCKENSEISSECAVTETEESPTPSTQPTDHSCHEELDSTKNDIDNTNNHLESKENQMDFDSSITQENDKNTSELNISSKESSGEKKDELNESMEISNANKEAGKEISTPLQHTPNKKLKSGSSKKLTPKQIEKKLEVEKRKQEKQKSNEERMKKKLEEKERALQEKMKKQEMKQKEIELRKKEKEEKEEARRKEKEEREQKRKEKEEKEKQKRKEREEEKLKKQQEIEEKNKEKLKEKEKKQKTAAAFVNFFVPKKVNETQDETRIQASNLFLQFEVKSDMKLPPPRRESLTSEQKRNLDELIEHQNTQASYLKELSSGKPVGRSSRTWPFEEPTDDIIYIDLGETICEDKSSLQRYRSKFLHFHENRRPAYYGTWRKKSKFIKPRRPFAEDDQFLNYEEDSDDDWEEEEQGESLNGSEDEAEKENEDEKDDYEVDNEFFVPHGHLSDDEVDDEETARLSPESLKQKLKLLKEEFDEDMQSKTQKLKPRSIGCIWYSKDDGNVDDPIDRCLQPFAMITRHTQIIIKSRTDIQNSKKDKKVVKKLDGELMASFLKIIHGSSKKKVNMIELFLTQNTVNVSKASLCNLIKKSAVYEKYKDEQTKKTKFHWVVHKEFRDKYNF